MRGQRGTLRALFLDQGNRFSRRQHKVQPWSEVVSEKKIFNDNGGLVVRFVGTQEISACRVRNDLINHNLYFFAWPFDPFYFFILSTRVDYGWAFVAKFTKYI